MAALVTDFGADLVVDVGANQGQAGRVLRAMGYGGRIVSFEPLAEPFAELRQASESDIDWDCRQLALGAAVGRAEMKVSGNEALSSSFLAMEQRHLDASPDSAYVGSEEVEVTTIDALAPQLIGTAQRPCMKLDVQGYELEVLRGAERTLPSIALIEVEVSQAELYEQQAAREELLAFLDRQGFVPIAEEPAFTDPRSGEVLQTNMMLANRARTDTAELRLGGWGAHVRHPLSSLRRDLRRLYWLSPVSRWLNPRIGRLPFAQHPPEPLTVPRSYRRTRPPSPAPTISVVTPSFNQGPFLEQTIRSVLSQGYPRLEYIVQDGGSTDSSQRILERYAEMLSHCESAPDSGQGEAINRGMERASGEILAWLNSDDLFLPGALAAVAQFFDRHPEVDLVHGNRIFVDEADRKVGVWVMPGHDEEANRWLDIVAQETMFWRRSAWERVGGMDERYHYALDWDLLLRFADAGVKMAHMSRFLGAFRVHDEQKSFTMARLEPEVAELQRRHLGRTTTWQQRMEATRPYFRRHAVLHNLHRVGQRLPVQREEVDFGSAELQLTPALGSSADRG